VDGSSLSVEALEFGFAEAVRLGVDVVAVHVAASHLPGGGNVDVLTEEHALEQARLLAEVPCRLAGEVSGGAHPAGPAMWACRSGADRSFPGSSPACRGFPWSGWFSWVVAGFGKPRRAPPRALPDRHRAQAG
jgi:hypothetical protein